MTTSTSPTGVVAYTGICEPDAMWIKQYLAEVHRVGIPYAVHFDRCSPETKARMTRSYLCVGHTSQDEPTLEYNEQHKQKVFDLVSSQGKWSWALNWDIDEIWEKDVALKLANIQNRTETHLRLLWANMWGDLDHIRYDNVVRPSPRVKLYRIDGGNRWKFDHPITNGCKLMDRWGRLPYKNGIEGDTDIVCLHAGLMTRELRLAHKERWDRIYTTAVGNNPYGFWNAVLDEETNPPTIIPNPYR